MSHNTVFGTILLFIGRVFISQLFIIAGFSKLVAFGQTASMMSSAGIPFAELALIIAIIFELGGGILLLFGLYTRLSTLLLFVFVIVVTYWFHSYWDYEGAAQLQNMQHFMKNLAIVGGLVYTFVCGAGRISFDHLFRKK